MAKRFVLECSCGATYSGADAIRSQVEAMKVAHVHVCAGHQIVRLEEK